MKLACVQTLKRWCPIFSSHMKRVDIVARASKVSSQDQKTKEGRNESLMEHCRREAPCCPKDSLAKTRAYGSSAGHALPEETRSLSLPSSSHPPRRFFFATACSSCEYQESSDFPSISPLKWSVTFDLVKLSPYFQKHKATQPLDTPASYYSSQYIGCL